MHFRQKTILLWLYLFWGFVQLLILNRFGIVTRLEATKYIYEAEYFLKQGHFSQIKYIFYSLYIFLHVLSIKLGVEFIGIYILQVTLNACAMLCLYRLSLRLTGDFGASNIAFILLTLCFPWQVWTTHLYTESVFDSLIVIFSYSLIRAMDAGLKWRVLAIIFFVLLIFARPTGILFVPVLILLFGYKFLRAGKKLMALITILLPTIIFLVLLNFEMRGEGEFDFMKPFRESQIICGVPEEFTNNLVLPKDGNNVQGLFYYIIHNPIHFSGLALKKIIYYFGMTRSYYSLPHNIYLIAFMYPIYLFAFAGLRGLKKLNKIYWAYSIFVIGIFAFSIILTCDDWLNRFVAPIMPFIVIAAAVGMKKSLHFIMGRGSAADIS